MEYDRSWVHDAFYWQDFPVVKILFTDYTNLAVVALCEQTKFDDNCNEHQLQVKVMTRHQRPISVEDESNVFNVLRNVCLEPGDFKRLSVKGNILFFSYSHFS